MDIEGFKKFCKEKEFTQEIIEHALIVIADFNDYIQDTGRTIDSAIEEDVKKFAQHLINAKKNQKETYFALIRYCYFSNNEPMLIALYELLDGSDVLNNLRKALTEVVGKEKSKEILQNIAFPELGTPSTEKPEITKEVMEALEANIDENTCHKVMVSNLHGIPKESYLKQREKFLEAKDVDEYLKNRHANFIERLEKHRNEKTLFYTQEIDDNVVELVRNNAQIEGGVRKDNIIYTEKIPYIAKDFLAAKDEKMKQYYYCHCGWVREALKTGETKVPSKFCKCSAGYYKNQWDVILDQPVEVDVIETILDGDSRCLFAIHLPEEIVKQTEKK